MFDAFTKNNGSDALLEGMYIGAKDRAQALEQERDELAQKVDKWHAYAKKLEKKIAAVAGERDAGIQTISAIIDEIKEIDKNPEKERFFSDPNNRLSRTSLFKSIADKRQAEITDGVKKGPVQIEERLVK